MTRLHRFAPLALAAALVGCDNESLMPPTYPGLVDPLFVHYVAFGNSITAGFQSAGINDSVQLRSYAALLAEVMGTEFNIPLLNRPGCPPPLVNVFTQEVVGNPGPLGCALRNPDIPPYLNNVAIPGAAVLDTFDPLGTGNSSNTLTTIMGGGRSQVDNAARVGPTFVTIWIGANDVLGAILDANPGNPAAVTPPADFAARYAAFMDSLDAFGTIEGGAVIGVPQVAVAPYLTQGRVWKGFEATVFDPATSPLNAFDVTTACLDFLEIPGTMDTAWASVPFAVGGPKLAEAQARVDSVLGGLLPPQNLQPVVLDCADDAQAATAAEVLNMFGAVAQYNAAVSAEATARQWVYIDPNPLLLALLGTPGQIRSFPAFDPADPQHVTAPFGSAFSLDGIHPSSATHVIIANALIQAINAAYGTSIPAVN